MPYGDIRNRATTQFLPNSSGSGRVLNIPLNDFILDGFLLLKGTVTLAGGTTSGTAIGDGGPGNLIKRIKLNANPALYSIYPGGELVNCTPRALLRNDAFASLGKYFGELSGSVLGSGAAAAYTIYMPIPINFADTNLRQQVQTALNANGYAYESLQLQIETGDITSCFAGNDRTATYDLSLEWIDRRVDMTPSPNPVVLYQEDHVVQIPAANDRLTDGGLPKYGNLLSLLLMTETSSAQTLSDTILNKVSIASPDYRYEQKAKDIRYRMIKDGWAAPDSAESKAGLYLIDFTEGVIQRSLAVKGMAIEYDVNNPGGANLDGLHIYSRQAVQIVTKAA